MNPVGKKNIEWAKLTTNAITGCNGPEDPTTQKCERCGFCYAERISRRFKDVHDYPKPDPFVPAFHPERLEQIKKRRKPTIYFFGSMGDWLDRDVKPEWRQQCLQVMAEKPMHVFITLTKQYRNLGKIAEDSPGGVIPRNVWVGISVNTGRHIWGIDELRKVDATVRLISFEPLLEDLADSVDLEGVDWIIIGGQSRQNGIDHLPAVPAFTPKKEWVQDFVYGCALHLPVFLKPNLGNYVGKRWFPGRIEQMPDIEQYAPEA